MGYVRFACSRKMDGKKWQIQRPGLSCASCADSSRFTFVNLQANKSKMNSDFEDYKNTPVYLLAKTGLLFEKMMAKWRNVYGEHELTGKFERQWQDVECTRVVINHIAEVPGGMPVDTNSVEVTHHVHKEHDNHIRFDGEEYVSRLSKWVHHKSANDMSFGLYLNLAVCSKRFFVAVRDMLEDDISPLTVCFGGSNGRLLCASQRTLNRLKVHPSAPTTAHDCCILLSTARPSNFVGVQAPSIVQSFVNGTEDPSLICSPLLFDECVAWGNSFYFLTPIPAGDYLRGLFDRLKNSGMKIDCSYEDLVLLGPNGLMSCSCSGYLHRAWCIHACVCAFVRGIICGYPMYKDPTPRDTSQRGRPCKNRPRKIRKIPCCPWEHDYESGDLLDDSTLFSDGSLSVSV
uniref:SWIM-type domain-containing protein n=1 Tax=Octactis speculum TaxID=3111310 RepID=A0A7S2DNR4_9STRA|mmetsp:Transcript_51879/g.70742  ORF Transcript_51879/g.70742 Transcript_51879/m.70742 type:complete len:402 (+) Transcript_51879:285-1490(+)